jgi:hypothetical protein
VCGLTVAGLFGAARGGIWVQDNPPSRLATDIMHSVLGVSPILKQYATGGFCPGEEGDRDVDDTHYPVKLGSSVNIRLSYYILAAATPQYRTESAAYPSEIIARLHFQLNIPSQCHPGSCRFL